MKNIARVLIGLMLLFFSTTSSATEKEWKEYKQQHFIVYYKGAPLDFVKSVESAAEDYYDEISKNLGFTRYKSWSWDERAKIYIYDSTEDYVSAGKQHKWSHGAASPADKVIRTFPTAHGFFDSTLPHELGHIIFREYIGFSTIVPVWFEEGVAMYQEKAKRWGAHQTVKDAIKDGSFIPLKDLTMTRLTAKSDDKLVQLFYAESASVVNFIINEFGQSRFERFCDSLKEGKSFETALTSVYVRCPNMESLNQSWKKFLGR